MALVDLSSDLSKFRSEVSRESKNTPEASKATNSKNFATIQPISEKLSQLATPVKKVEPKKLEDGLPTTKLDDIRKIVNQNLLVNRISKFSRINEDFSNENLGTLETQAIASRFSRVSNEEFKSKLNKSDTLILKKESGTNNLQSPTEVSRMVNEVDRSKTSPTITRNPSDASNNITDPDIEITRKNLFMDRTAQSPNLKVNPNDATDNITDPKTDILRARLSSDRADESPIIKVNPNDSSDNVTIPDIEVIKQVQSLNRENTSPKITINKDDASDNIQIPDLEIFGKPLSFDRTSQSVVIAKDLVSPLNNIINPDIALDTTPFIFDREGQSPSIETDPAVEGFITNPDTKVFRIENGTNHLIDESDLNRDGKIPRFVVVSRLENFEPPAEVDTEKYNQESIQLVDNSFLNLDTVTKTIPFGRHEDPNQSSFSVIGTQAVNFFPDSNVKGFVVKAQQGETNYVGQSVFGWSGNKSAAPSTNFIDNVNAKGFTTFVQQGTTEYETESSVFGFTKTPETNYFDVVKTYTGNGFKSFATQLETDYKQDASVFTFKGQSTNAPTVDFFDKTNQSTTQGFVRFTQPLNSFYVNDASVFTWSGPRGNAPEVNYFDLQGQSSTAGFHKFSSVYDSKYIPDSSIFDWDGKRGDAPEVNYFDLGGVNSDAGFHKFPVLLESKYIPDSSQFDWDGTRNDAPVVNYFDLTGKNTNEGFHKFPVLLESKYIADSSQFDWDGNKQNAPEVNYFDITGKNTSKGFEKFPATYDSKYIPDSSQFDWDGTRNDAPEVNYFDLNGKNTSTGFHKFPALYDSKYVAESSEYDWNGSKQDAPEVNFFDLNGKNTTKGFHKFPALYDTKYVKDSSLYDFDGNNQTAPEVNFFDLQSKYTTKGFEKFPQRMVTKYVKDSSTFDFDGPSRSAPKTNFFPDSKAKGFTTFPVKLETEYVKDSSEFTFKGTLPKEINFFDDGNQTGFINKTEPLDSKYKKDVSKYTFKGTLPKEINFFSDTNQSGFINRTAALESKFEKDSSTFTFKGTLPEPVNFLPDTSAPGFHLRAAALETKYIEDISQFTFKGTRQDAPTVNYMFNDFNEGFTKLAQPLTSEFKPDISRFTFKGSKQEAPAVDYLDNTSAFGFKTFTTPLESVYKKETSRFTWNGSRQDAPNVDFFKIPGSNPNGIAGFTTLFEDITQNKLTDKFSRFSFASVTNYASVKNVPYTKFFGFTPTERSGFLVNMVDRNSSLYPILDPVLTVDSPANIRFAIEGQRGQSKRQRTSDDPGKYARITLGGLYWSDGTNTGTAKLDNQVPWMKVKGTEFGSSYLRKYEKLAKDNTERLGYLTKWATKRNSPSPLDDQYNKYKLEKESFNIGTNRQPYIVRGIQREGEVENQRWGIFGTTFDEGLVRGGAVTAADRALNDGLRLLNFSTSWPRGILFIAKQVGLQLMNPVTDVDPINFITSGFPLVYTHPSTLFYNPVTSLGSAVTSVIGMRMPRHGLLPTSIFLNKYERATINREGKANLSSPDYKAFENLPTAGVLDRDPGGYNRLIGLMKELLPKTFEPTAIIGPRVPLENKNVIQRLTTFFGGPKSFLGIGGTSYTLSGHPYLTKYTTSPDLYQDRNPKYGDFMKRETYFAAAGQKRYQDLMKDPNKSLLGALFYLLTPPGSTTKKPSTAPDTIDSLDVHIQSQVKTMINRMNTFSPKYPLESYRAKAIKRSDTPLVYENQKMADGGQKDDGTFIKRYRTLNYDKLRKTDNRFNDFRLDLNTDAKDLGSENSATFPRFFNTNPQVMKYKTDNLTDKYGFGEHGKPGSDRWVPFRTHIRYEKGTDGSNVPVNKNPNGAKFRGDRINIIDYKRINGNLNKNKVYEKDLTGDLKGKDDLIEFYFSSLDVTGNKNSPAKAIVFRATFDSISDSHNPSWNAVKYMGRADPLYIYQGYEREISFGFTVHIGSRDEMKASWRKLNYLASWTAPEYTKAGYIKGPMIRLNIGHLYRKMPGYISSLQYTFDNTNGYWETAGLMEDTNLTNAQVVAESTPGVLQLPKLVQVSISFVPVGVYRPEFEGIFYSLYDDSETGDTGEFGLMPLKDSKRTNYFREVDPVNTADLPDVISGVDNTISGTVAERHYANKPEQVVENP